jgi:hypothetical protein
VLLSSFGQQREQRVRADSVLGEERTCDILGPQPAFVEAADQITGSILDAGCGTGENALFRPQLAAFDLPDDSSGDYPSGRILSTRLGGSSNDRLAGQAGNHPRPHPTSGA